MQNVAIVLVVCTACTACTTGDALEREFDHYQVPCLAEAYFLCPLARSSEAEPWAKFFDPVQGWTPTWGVSATLSLREMTPVSVSNTSRTAYRLLDIIDEVRVDPGTTFLFPFEPTRVGSGAPPVQAEGDGGAFMDGQRFTCADDRVCAAFRDAAAGRGTVVLTLAYVDPTVPSLELLAVSVQ